MSTSIIGTGRIGSALAHIFARHGVDALIANTRGPQSFTDLAADIAASVRPVPLAEALESETLILAIPFLATAPLGATRSDWSGHLIVDATNAFLVPNATQLLAGRPSTAVVAHAFPGAWVVKAFNQLPAPVLQQKCRPTWAGRSCSCPVTTRRPAVEIAELGQLEPLDEISGPF
jgi:8-hydroxy-5-deazaflavin:NADPH oxidoreductase